MMMIPRKHDFDLFDDVFGDSFFNEGASRLMKTDIKEKKNEYIIDIDLPGWYYYLADNSMRRLFCAR